MADPFDTMQGRPLEEFPAGNVPVAFADGVSSFVNAGGVAKFYFYRIDPNLWGRGGAVYNPVVQVVMPSEAFPLTAAFLVAQVKRMIASKQITQENWDGMVDTFSTLPGSKEG